jgi:hypothetical protein
MDPDEFIRVCPKLYHMAELGCWERAQKQGLLSTTSLLDLYGIPGAQRLAIESEIRPECVTLTHVTHGTAIIRDNKPLRRENLEKRLKGMSVKDWCEMLNRHVFFWPSEDHLSTLLNARAYQKLEHEVITIDTADLVKRYPQRIRLSPINSGNTIYPPKRKYGEETFYAIADYPYEQRRKERGPRDAIVEIAVEDGVSDIEDLAILVERRQRNQVLNVLHRR